MWGLEQRVPPSQLGCSETWFPGLFPDPCGDAVVGLCFFIPQLVATNCGLREVPSGETWQNKSFQSCPKAESRDGMASGQWADGRSGLPSPSPFVTLGLQTQCHSCPWAPIRPASSISPVKQGLPQRQAAREMGNVCPC